VSRKPRLATSSTVVAAVVDSDAKAAGVVV
jgi:hypothetical protein